MKILYLGRDSGTSRHRKQALVRLGHAVTSLDPQAMVPSNRITSLWEWRAGAIGLSGIIRRRLLRALDGPSIADRDFDLAWVDHGSLVDARLVRELKARARRVLCYTIDDPFGDREPSRWRQFFPALPHYDLLVVVRACNVREAYDRGARRVMRVYMAADEAAHAPRQLTDEDRRRWQSEVVFVGTAFPERGPFLAELVRLGVPLTLFGKRYQRLPQWPILRPFWRPDDTDSADDYARAVSAAKVCLGLLSKGNRDQHTTRSMEIPSMGGLLCAERTPEHLALYQEDREAVFWSTPQECASKCLALLADPPRRRAVAAAGRQRYLSGPGRNMAVAQSILDAILQSPPLESSSAPISPTPDPQSPAPETAARAIH